MLETHGAVPVGFEPNRGQTDERVKFFTRGRDYTLFLTNSEVVLVFETENDGREGERNPGTTHPTQIPVPKSFGLSLLIPILARISLDLMRYQAK